MILKSFFRRKSTIIFFFILLTIYLVIFSLIISLNYLNNRLDSNYQKRSILYAESSKDIKSILQEDNNLKDIARIIAFTYKGNIINDYSISNFNNIVYAYASNDLKNNEIILNMTEYDYLNYKNVKGEKITFYLENVEYSFIIKDVVQNNKKYINISDEKYNEFLSNSKFCYTATILKQDKAFDSKDRLIKKGINSYDIMDYYENEQEEQYKLKNYIKKLKYAIFIISIIFFLSLTIINYSIISELDKNIFLEYCLGYNRKNIVKNIFIRLFLINILAYIIPIISYIMFSIILKTNINYNIILLILVFIFSEIIFLSYCQKKRLINNKLNL